MGSLNRIRYLRSQKTGDKQFLCCFAPKELGSLTEFQKKFLYPERVGNLKGGNLLVTQLSMGCRCHYSTDDFSARLVLEPQK